MSGNAESKLNGGYYRLMLYAALFGAFSSLLTAGYITLYNQGVKFFGQANLFLFNINFWPLVPVEFRRCVYWPCYQVLWTAWGIGSCTAPICPDRPPQLSQPTKHTSSRIYSVMEWCGSRS